MAHGFKSSNQNFIFGPWTVKAVKTHIMKSKDIERLADEMQMPSLPEMLFGDNVLRVQHKNSFGIEFNAKDALQCVNNLQDSVKVACAQEWQESRSDCEHSKEVVKRYDWTFTTDYKGTLLGDELKLKVMPTSDRIDMEKLKTREQIVFFEEVLLFEDELHDHGVSMLNVKIADKNYMLREFSCRENRMSNFQHIPPAIYTDPNEICQYLPLNLLQCEKLEFPENMSESQITETPQTTEPEQT
uniref:TIP41-like protein n=1 Tax=Erpetoichthys calabaricus TaxID=27687 RepID=A0A8C4S564_ERPCA